jgi:O-antigen/teichoic acid export membrane protein
MAESGRLQPTAPKIPHIPLFAPETLPAEDTAPAAATSTCGGSPATATALSLNRSKMRHWFRDQHFRSLLKNSSYLGLSQIVAAVTSLATLAFAGRTLGVELFGLLILIHAYVDAASNLSKFQSWQLVVRYGGQVLVSGDAADFKTATGFSIGLDLLSSVIGMAGAMLLLPLIGPRFGIPSGYLTIALLYCTLIPTYASMTPSGVLRVLDRFDLISWQGTIQPISRAILAGIAWAANAPFITWLAIWYLTSMGSDLYFWFIAWRQMKRRNLHRGVRPTLRPTQLRGAWRFAIHVNLTSSLSGAWAPVSRLIVGGLLGRASAALYAVASNLADAAQKPTNLLARAFYPEVARMDVKSKRPWKLMLRGSAVAGAVGLGAIGIVVIGGRPLIELVFGHKFAAAYVPLMVLMVMALLAVVSFPFAPMLYALDRPEAPLVARIAGTLSYLAVVVPLALNYRLAGAAAAFVIGYAVMTGILAIQLRRGYERARAR